MTVCFLAQARGEKFRQHEHVKQGQDSDHEIESSRGELSHINHRIPRDSHWEMCQMCRLLHVTCKCVSVGGTAGVKKGSKLLSKNLEKANQLLEVKAALEQLSIDGT